MPVGPGLLGLTHLYSDQARLLGPRLARAGRIMRKIGDLCPSGRMSREVHTKGQSDGAMPYVLSPPVPRR